MRRSRTPIQEGHPIHLLDEQSRPYGIPHIRNKPRISSMPFCHDVGLGRVPGCTAVRKFGHNADVGSDWETVWSGGGIYPYLSSAEILKVSSTDADDTAAGDGARTLELFGLGGNYVQQSEIITLNGQSSVATAEKYLRVYRAIVRSAGSSGWNQGTLNVKDNADSVTLLVIEPEINQTLMALFTIPRRCTGYITDWYASSSSLTTKLVELALFVRPFEEVFQIKSHVEVSQFAYRDDFSFPLTIETKGDIEVRAKAAAAGGVISGGFRMWFARN